MPRRHMIMSFNTLSGSNRVEASSLMNSLLLVTRFNTLSGSNRVEANVESSGAHRQAMFQYPQRVESR